ncbi:major facilitator superfamily domain-containing protein [Mycena filopes]|nr:major facilitator superfamily domain-containing protein [Mycena filopes]
MNPPNEDTPLLAAPSLQARKTSRGPVRVFTAYHRVLFGAFLLAICSTLSWSAVLYAYRVFNCDEYYADPTHPPYSGTGDACAISVIEAKTAQDISLMSVIATICGLINTVITAWQIRNWGVRPAMVQQSFWPAFRSLCQLYALGFTRGRLGINIFQACQVFTFLGGSFGYRLVANSYITEIVAPAERTAAFGVLAGVMMFGMAFGYSLSGFVYDFFGLTGPFKGTSCILVLSTVYNALFLPYIPPLGSAVGPTEPSPRWAFLDGLGIFLPAKYEDRSGRFWGLTLLGLGSFLAALATQYVPNMLQLTATNEYGYTPSDNGRMSSLNALARALFLTFAFPWIIDTGRIWFNGRQSVDDSGASSQNRVIPTMATSVSPMATTIVTPPPTADDTAEPDSHPKMRESAFDLEFVRWSILADVVLTALVSLNTQSWNMIAAATLLPLASGTAPAAKGVLTAIVPEARRADALAAIAMIETLALIATVSLFGPIFGFLSTIGRPNLVYIVNASVAFVATVVLFMVRFPRGRLRSA